MTCGNCADVFMPTGDEILSIIDLEREASEIDLHTDVWLKLRPLVLMELKSHMKVPEAGFDQEPFFVRWGSHLRSVFERTVADEKEDRPSPSPIPTTTKKEARFEKTGPRVLLRGLRETHLECVCAWPVCGAVSLDPELWSTGQEHWGRTGAPETGGPSLDASDVAWAEGGGEEDNREVWRTDGETTLSYPEFLLWSARVGGMGNCPHNEKYLGKPDGEPVGYVPLCWAGETAGWRQQMEQGWPNCFWMRGASAEVVAQSMENADVCKVCLIPRASAPKGKLLACSCKEIQYCGKECQKRDWKRHKEDGHF
jgi:hypothetical protein